MIIFALLSRAELYLVWWWAKLTLPPPPPRTDYDRLDEQLVWAVMVGNQNKAYALLSAGASPYALNAQGQNCFEIARLQDNEEMVNLLSLYGHRFGGNRQ